MLLAFYTAGAILPIVLVAYMVGYLIFKKNHQVILCTECQQCKAACPLLSKGCNPVDIMLAAKSGQYREAMEKGTRLCVSCGKCQEVCPRGLAPYREVEKWKSLEAKKSEPENGWDQGHELRGA